MNYDLTSELDDSGPDVNESGTQVGLGAMNPTVKEIRSMKFAKSRTLLKELETGLAPCLKSDLNARRIIQVCIILENILDGLEKA